MPITVEEILESRRSTTGPNPTAELVYSIEGTTDDLAARAALETEAPTTHDTIPRQSVSVEPNGRSDLWTGTARYGITGFGAPATGQSTFTFDTSGGTQHITQALATSGSFAPVGKTAPDHKGAIGVTPDAVQGVDITVPVYAFSETHYIPDASVDNAYKANLLAITGSVNDAVFRGFAVGEVLFLGASGSKRSDDDWEINFRFAASLNKTGITIGDIANIAKKGWEYLWVLYEDAEDAAAEAIVKRPVAAYVEQVYRLGNFLVLGI